MAYLNQYGGRLDSGLLVYRPNLRRQHGFGLGSFFGSAFRRLAPLAQKYILPHAKNAVQNIILPHAKTAVQNIAREALAGRNLKESLIDNSKSALKAVAGQVFNQSGSGCRGRKRKLRFAPKSRKKLRKTDYLSLFD